MVIIILQITCLTEDTQEIIDHGFFYGYTPYVLLIIFMQAVTGLVSLFKITNNLFFINQA